MQHFLSVSLAHRESLSISLSICFFLFTLWVQFISDDKNPINPHFNTTSIPTHTLSFRVIKRFFRNKIRWNERIFIALKFECLCLSFWLEFNFAREMKWRGWRKYCDECMLSMSSTQCTAVIYRVGILCAWNGFHWIWCWWHAHSVYVCLPNS